MRRTPNSLPFFLLPLLVVLLISQRHAFGQTDTLPLPDRNREILEDAFQNAGAEDADFDYNDQFDQLERYISRPLNLNKASEIALRDLGLLTDLQILNLLQYRQTAGELISIYELQAIPGFDSASIQRILPYVGLQGALDDFQTPLGEMLTKGRNEAQFRWSRFMEPQEGYEQENPEKGYLGDANQFFFRYRHTYYNRLSYGLTADKDRGEPFFKDHNPEGFDFYSAHFFLRGYNKLIKAVALGDYRVSFGQGLILFSGFGYGKSALSTSIKRSSLPLRASASASETGFLRGAAATFGLGPSLTLTPFISYRKRDGNLTGNDSLSLGLLQFSSFNESGYHRTTAEEADRGQIRHLSAGMTLQWDRPGIHLGINALHNELDPVFDPKLAPYNQFYFRGKTLSNLSADYAFRLANVNLFGETAWSDNGAIATVNGLLATLDRKADLALLFRYLPRNYQALDAIPFSDGSGGRNETGIYAGLELRPIPQWTFNGYADFWTHPWLRFTADGPTRGREFRIRATFEKRRKLRVYGEIRHRSLEQNGPEALPFRTPEPEEALTLRLHVSNQVSKALELRTRLDWGWATPAGQEQQSGMVLLQDVIFHPIESPISFSARFAVFDTDGYAMRFYHYENDLLNAFSIPAYYNRGYRFYLNLRYRPIRNLTLETRYARTYWSNQEAIGTGLEAISGPYKTQVSSQIKWVFDFFPFASR
ncbi:MAG: helix-hairpin-helix domain-containing protein [Haliscomenobacter sp.]|nr:helix-hairpin-helix domain-containing protein [Haliscomenobacter sp.]